MEKLVSKTFYTLLSGNLPSDPYSAGKPVIGKYWLISDIDEMGIQRVGLSTLKGFDVFTHEELLAMFPELVNGEPKTEGGIDYPARVRTLTFRYRGQFAGKKFWEDVIEMNSKKLQNPEANQQLSVTESNPFPNMPGFMAAWRRSVDSVQGVNELIATDIPQWQHNDRPIGPRQLLKNRPKPFDATKAAAKARQKVGGGKKW